MTSSEVPTPSLRVLLVDDHPDLLAMLDLMMQRRKYAVRTAQSGSEALEIVPEFAPHVIISDIGMPEMDGCEMMRSMRGNANQSSFKSIALSGYDEDMEGERIREAGFDAHVQKPIEFDELFALIEDLVQE